MPTKKKTKKKTPDIDIKVRNLDKVAEEWKEGCCGGKCKKSYGCGGCGYFLGFLGAAVYYLKTTDGFWLGVLGLLKALVWPAFLVFELLKFIGA